ncbi:unnamed protein product [Calypogeia fissa]
MDRLVAVSALTVVGLLSRWQLSKRSSKSESADKTDDKSADKNGVPITDPNWQWPIYDQYRDKEGQSHLKKRDAKEGDEDESEGAPFRVIYRNKKLQIWPDVVKITLYSRPLIDIIALYLPKNGDLKTLAAPKIGGRELCIVLEELKKHIEQSSDGDGKCEHDHGKPNSKVLSNGDSIKTHLLENGDSSHEEKETEDEGKLHLKHLVRFMEKEYRDVVVRVQRMEEEKQVTWDLLWAFLPAGKKVVYSCDHSEELLYAVVNANYFQFSSMEGWFFIVELDVWEFDGRSYKKCQAIRRIRKYEGERSFVGMAVCPVELIGNPEMLEERFLENGKKYLDLTMLTKHRFMHYTGPLFQQRKDKGDTCWQLYKENADGRVMIDLDSFAKMNPRYPMGNAQPPSASRSWIRRSDGSYTNYSAPHESYNSSMVVSEVSDENLIFAPAIVYGFSFTLKMWGSFAISGFRDISFDSSAFHELVMDSEMKSLVHNLVSHYIATPVDRLNPKSRLHRVDPISNKGNGCVFLCYGPPGTGKTLTAESLAETMGRPLWALSVSELGTTPKELEQTLFKVLDIAAAWRAVLLLDEADVYLERRISGADLTRNAMTGVFLRMLEYYRGVLFLTTNRIGTFDEAFRSRISMFLHYESLTTEHKQQIWKTLFEKARIRDVDSEKLSELANLDLNGREIRNAIHTAQSWAHSKGESLEIRHIQYVMTVVSSSLKSLNEALNSPAYN